MRSIFYTLIAALAITHGAMAYDGYNIPCSYGGGGNCICDAGSCQEYSWNDSLETFMCGSGKGGNGKCSCVDAQYNKTIEFPCGCTSDSDCDGPGWGCINGQCQTCRTCSNCNTTSWTNGNTGYQTRTVRTCGCTTGQCTSNTEYRCAGAPRANAHQPPNTAVRRDITARHQTVPPDAAVAAPTAAFTAPPPPAVRRAQIAISKPAPHFPIPVAAAAGTGAVTCAIDGAFSSWIFYVTTDINGA